MEWEKVYRLVENIDVVGIIYLWKYEDNYNSLYQRLLELRREHYAPNQKIVVIHENDDYYYHGNPTGFIIHNLMNVVEHLNISPSSLIFLSPHHNLESGLAPFITDNDRPTFINTLVGLSGSRSLLDLCDCSIEKNIEQNALCLLGTVRRHRVLLYQLMSMYNCFESIDVNFNSKNAPLNHHTNQSSNKIIDPALGPVKNLGIVYSTPHRINDDWAKYLRPPELSLAIRENVPESQTHPNLHGEIPDFYNRYGIDIVVETGFDYPLPYVTEKTWRPLMLQAPFVLVGPAGALKALHRYGFKTFDDLWDESYDDILDPQCRLLACANVIKEISSWPLQQVKDAYAHVYDRLIQNRLAIREYLDNVYPTVYNSLKVKISNL